MRGLFKPIITALVGALWLCTSCSNDEQLAPYTDEDRTVLQFTIQLPASSGQTRAITDIDENNISQVDILAFMEHNGEMIYDYTATVTNVDDTATPTVVITATAYENTLNQQFMILINGSTELSHVTLSRFRKLTDIETDLVSAKLDGHWNVASSSSFTPIPMYGLTTPQVVNSSTGSMGTFPVLRMLARVNVTLASGVGNFKLKSAGLYNYKKAGYISYSKSGYASGVATTPAVPASGDHSGSPILAPTTMAAADYSSDTRGTIINEIYSFESPAIASDAERITRTALIVCGDYTDGGGITHYDQYYRIDFKPTTSTTSNISDGLLRNHTYEVKIQSVSTLGSNSGEEAYIATSLTATVTAWNDAEQSAQADEQYYLTVSGDNFLIDYFGDTAKLTAETDYDNTVSQGFAPGIIVSDVTYNPTVTTGNEWLTLAVSGSVGDTQRTISMTVPQNRSGEQRTATFYVQAGNFKKQIEVWQYDGYYPSAHNGWAGSNIYWDGDKLTFDDVGDTTNQYYQGVMFQWGSLWGIAPAYSGNWSSTSTILYPPTGGTATGYDWSSWPRVDDTSIISNPPADKSARDRHYLYEITDGSTGLGDICKYITEQATGGLIHGKKWRMPTSTEFGAATDYAIYGTWSLSFTTNTSGQATVSPGWKKYIDNTATTPSFPASGFRFNGSGALNNASYYGYYWSGSPSNNTSNGNNISYYLSFSGTAVSPDANTLRANGFAVRCVVE